ncbi:hypothetical protein B0H34DRAFT_369698 [Crassisporium funariophilum]|nr:hypothetical protein B0H34DRAFT_369698 [Crassisporium funariophilum]
MAELQKKLAELREENSKIQLALKEAADAKLSKEGEISILRKSIEKTAHSHATQLAQMKAEKEKADARQVQMQKETKDEMERLRTQFIFRQQELESTIRKPPASVRLKKINRELPSTPVAVPSVIRSWNANASQSVLPRTNVEETPLRPSRLLPVWKASPSSQSRKSPEKAKKQGMLPGFQNAFVTSTPMKSPTKRLNKGKGRLDYVSDTFGGQPSQDFHNLPQETIDLTQSMPDDATMSQGADKTAEPTPYNLLGPKSLPAKDDDMDADVVEENEEDPSLEIPDVIEEINWKAKLSYTILTHCHPTSRLITFQKLLGISQSGDSGMEYSMACASVLEVVANTATADDYEESLRILSRSLLSLLAILTDTEQLFDVAILLDLLSKLVLTLPKFRDMLLSSQIGSDTSILDITTKDIISLLESFCFQASPESIKRLEAIPRNREVLMTLLHTSHPTWLLERVSRLLVLLSTQHALCRVLLDVPVTIGAQNQGFDEPTKNPLIERLCTHLIDTSRPDPEMFKIYILIFIAQLSIAHPDAHAVLVGSYVLIPSLILFVTHLTTPLWEDDGKLDASPETTSSFIRTLNQTITLLYHLIFQTDPALNLRVKLQHAPHRPFNSISHMFVVTFGRLSYCEPPGWINAEGRQELEILSELAREILEVVVDGPETDSLWVAFQTEPEGDSVTDEEEMEARLMGVDA